MAARRVRLDRLLVDRGLAPTREKAQGMILAGEVEVEGERADKPGRPVAPAARVVLRPRRPDRVGRGGEKLEGALRAFGLDVAGRVALDIGASTGGFTECLLRAGAGAVIALDVGRGQLDWSLRNDPRVIPVEGVNARHLDAGDLPAGPGPVDLVVCDVSFISLRLILPAIARVLAGGEAVVLVKPQFEAGPGSVSKGGILRDEAARERAVRSVVEAAIEEGFEPVAICAAHPPGARGNRELFLHLRRRAAGAPGPAAPGFEDSLLRALEECRSGMLQRPPGDPDAREEDR